jgi:hypothetical protein
VPRRRPSPAIVIALVALFVALGVPAQAARFIDGKLLRPGSVRSAAVKDRSLQVRDLSRPAVRALQATPNGSVTAAKIANGSVTAVKLANRSVMPAKLATGSVGTAALADRSVSPADLALGAVRGEHVADGSLGARHFARFHGRFSVEIGRIPFGRCWSGEPIGLAPERAGANIGGDVVLVTPDDQWVERRVTFTVRASANPSRFVLAACNVGVPIDGPSEPEVAARAISFSYLILDV